MLVCTAYDVSRIADYLATAVSQVRIQAPTVPR